MVLKIYSELISIIFSILVQIIGVLSTLLVFSYMFLCNCLWNSSALNFSSSFFLHPEAYWSMFDSIPMILFSLPPQACFPLLSGSSFSLYSKHIEVASLYSFFFRLMKYQDSLPYVIRIISSICNPPVNFSILASWIVVIMQDRISTILGFLNRFWCWGV